MAETHAYSNHAINLLGISQTGSSFSFVCFSLSSPQLCFPGYCSDGWDAVPGKWLTVALEDVALVTHVHLYVWRWKFTLAIQINTWNNCGDQKVTMGLCHVIREGLSLSLLSPNKRKLPELAKKEDNQHTGFTSKLLLAPENNIMTLIWCIFQRNEKYSEAAFLSYLGHDLIQ